MLTRQELRMFDRLPFSAKPAHRHGIAAQSPAALIDHAFAILAVVVAVGGIVAIVMGMTP